MIRLVDIIEEIIKRKRKLVRGIDWGYSAILPNDPVKFFWGEGDDYSHFYLYSKLFFKEAKEYEKKLKKNGYEWDGDAMVEFNDYIAIKKNIVEIRIEGLGEGSKLYFNTPDNKSPTTKQLSFLIDFCIEKKFKLIWDMGTREKEIEL